MFTVKPYICTNIPSYSRIKQVHLKKFTYSHALIYKVTRESNNTASVQWNQMHNSPSSWPTLPALWMRFKVNPFHDSACWVWKKKAYLKEFKFSLKNILKKRMNFLWQISLRSFQHRLRDNSLFLWKRSRYQSTFEKTTSWSCNSSPIPPLWKWLFQKLHAALIRQKRKSQQCNKKELFVQIDNENQTHLPWLLM